MNRYIASIKEKAGRHKTLIQNFSYLSILQIVNITLPLVTYPYLIRVLGKETYGLVVFAQAVMAYLVILTGFGFQISATREVSIHREDKEKLSEIVSSILILKGGLLTLAIVILGGLIFLLPQAQGHRALFLLTLWMCVYDVIFPIWYFQGIEQMKYITYLTLISRLTFLGLIFVFIHHPGDYLFIPIINGIGALLAGTTSLFIVFVKHQIRFRFQPYKTLSYYFKDSIPIFLSGITSRLYVSTNKIVVGIFLTMGDVAYYDLAEKIVTVLKIPQQILGQTIFPKISKTKNLKLAKTSLFVSFIINGLFYVVILVLGANIVRLLGGNQLLDAQAVLRILGITLPFIAISNILGVQLLIPFGRNKEFTTVIMLSGLIYLISLASVILLGYLSIEHVSAIIVLNELFVAAGMFYYCRKFRLI